ncbi:MAG: hypothetical protein NTV00_16550 [Methylococcales bacterium]|nr:hypothetical protein [Methylococcales bacterium]
MGDVTLSLLNGKHRVAEHVFGWNQSTVAVGINEFKTGITCINDLSLRLNPATEVKNPMLLADITAIMEPQSESESSLLTTLLYIHMTEKVVYDALVAKDWRVEALPTVRTISNILNRQGYRLRSANSEPCKLKLNLYRA